MEAPLNAAGSTPAIPQAESANPVLVVDGNAAPVRVGVRRGKRGDPHRLALTEAKILTLSALIFLYFFIIALARGEVAYLSLFWWGIIPHLILGALYSFFGRDNLEKPKPARAEPDFRQARSHPGEWSGLPGVFGWLTPQRLYVKSGAWFPLRSFRFYETRDSRNEGWLVLTLQRGFWRRSRMAIAGIIATFILSLGAWAQVIAALALAAYNGPRFDLVAVFTAGVAILALDGCVLVLLTSAARAATVHAVEVALLKDSPDLEQAVAWLREAGLRERRRKSKAR